MSEWDSRTEALISSMRLDLAAKDARIAELEQLVRELTPSETDSPVAWLVGQLRATKYRMVELGAMLKAADDHESHWQKVALEYVKRIDELETLVSVLENDVSEARGGEY